MADVLVQDVTFRFAEESTPGEVPTDDATKWQDIDPNTIDASGVDIATTSRRPIGTGGQLEKGVPTGLTSPFNLTGDMTWDFIRLFAQGSTYSNSTQADLEWYGGVSTTSSGFNVGTLSSAIRDKIIYSSSGPASLFVSRGFMDDANNGLSVVSTAPTSGGVIGVSGLTLTSEGATSDTTLEIAGIRFPAGELALTVNSGLGVATLSTTSSGFDWADTGLIVGQEIHIGGVVAANRFNAGFGIGRIRSISAASLTIEEFDSSLDTDTGDSKSIDVLFGGYYRNVPREHNDYNRRSYVFETRMPGIGPGGETGNEYSVGNIFSESTITITDGALVTMTMNFVGRDTNFPVMDANRAGGAENSRDTVSPAPMSAAVNIPSIRVSGTSVDIDEFIEFTANFNRNATARRIIGQLKARGINPGDILATMNGTAIMTSDAVQRAIRNSTTSSLSFQVRNDEGGAVFSIHSMTLSGGQKGLNNNEEATIQFAGQGFRNRRLNTTFGVSLFPVLPKLEVV